MTLIAHLDHLVLSVADIEASCAFYTGVLGMRRETFGNGRTALIFGHQKINLHPADGEPILPRAAHPAPGSADLCFIAAVDLDSVIARLAEHSVPIEVGPVDQAGATGPIRSVYVRDADSNLVEISVPADR